MKKVVLFAAGLLLMAGCSKHGQADGVVADSDSVQYYIDKARWGDGDAFLKLARYYRDGVGVTPDFLMALQMGMMAEEYGAIPNLDSLFYEVSDENNIKVIYDANKLFEQPGNEDQLMAKSDLLLERDCSEGYVFKALASFKQGKNDEALTWCEKAIKSGSVLAVIAKDGILNRGEDELQLETLLNISDRVPFAYRLLGEHYAKMTNNTATDVDSAVKYYRKADENGCLGREGAIWLLDAIKIKGVAPTDSQEVKRLNSLMK